MSGASWKKRRRTRNNKAGRESGGLRTEEGKTVSERKTDQREKDWTDEIPDEEEQEPSSYEETYRDGSPKNECWKED